MILTYLTLALAAASLLVGILILVRLKTVHYLLQQPVVKKMSPQLRLKPVKLDEVLNRGGREGARPEGGDRGPRRDGDRGPRPERGEGRRDDRGPRADRGDRPERGPRPEGDRGPRPERAEGDRGPRREDRGPRRDGDRPRGDRPERAEGDRPRREDRPESAECDRPLLEDRPRLEDRPEGDRPRREFSETRDFAPAPQAEASSESAPLSPRRPLFADSAEPRSEAAPFRETPASENFVGSSSDDLQHGRRLQLKKKPKFDFEEEGTTEA